MRDMGKVKEYLDNMGFLLTPHGKEVAEWRLYEKYNETETAAYIASVTLASCVRKKFDAGQLAPLNIYARALLDFTGEYYDIDEFHPREYEEYVNLLVGISVLIETRDKHIKRKLLKEIESFIKTIDFRKGPLATSGILQ